MSAERDRGASEPDHRLVITVFSDFTCPYSYLAEAVLWQLPRSDVDLRFRAFELFPDGVPTVLDEFNEADWKGIQSLASEVGVEVKLPNHRPATSKAHEASVFARDRDIEVEFRRETYSSYWQQSADIGRIDVLTGIIARLGVDPDDLRIALDIDRYYEEVAIDNDLGKRLRIPGTPTIFLGTGPSARIVTGAFAPDELRGFVNEAIRWNSEKV